MIWGSEVMLHGCKKQYNPFNSKIYLQQIFKYNKTYIFVKISFWKTSTRCHICNTNIFAKLNIPLNKNPFRQNNIKKLLFKSLVMKEIFLSPENYISHLSNDQQPALNTAEVLTAPFHAGIITWSTDDV